MYNNIFICILYVCNCQSPSSLQFVNLKLFYRYHLGINEYICAQSLEKSLKPFNLHGGLNSRVLGLLITRWSPGNLGDFDSSIPGSFVHTDCPLRSSERSNLEILHSFILGSLGDFVCPRLLINRSGISLAFFPELNLVV